MPLARSITGRSRGGRVEGAGGGHLPGTGGRMAARAHLPRVAVACVAVTLLAAGCGADEESGEGASEAAATAGATEETARSGTGEGDTTADSTVRGATGSTERSLPEPAPTGTQPCPDVVITPNSGNGLFNVEAEGITCEDAAAALRAWGASGYPGDSPPGFACEEVSTAPSGSARLSCTQQASGALLEFDTGG